ncbi:MAG: right-handed parallel beta-helix repeat-containing protein, partial [Gemmatimonadales bacterium]
MKTPRDNFYKGYRVFGLSLKDVLPNTVVNGMAGRFGLLAPYTTAVPVFLNNRYNGMYRFLETIDESFLRPIPRMPGNIFRGDAAERGDYFKGVPRGVFENPYIWDRVANNDRPNGPKTTHLPRFINDVNGSSFEDHVRLMGHVEREEIARLMAYYLIFGDPYHADAVHNQFWYEDPSDGVLHPIPWDVRLLDLSVQRQRLNAFLRAALRDPFLVDMILPEVKAHLDAGIIARADSMAHALENRYADEFAYDRLRAGIVPSVGRAAEIEPILEKNAAYLRGWMADDTIAVGISEGGGTVILDLVLRGHAGSDLVAFTAPGGSPALRQDRNRNGRLDSGDPALPLACGPSGQGIRCALNTPDSLLVGWDGYGPEILPSPVNYRYFITGTSGPVAPDLVNRVTRTASALVTIPAGATIPEARSFSPWRFPVVEGRTLRLSGSVVIMDTLRVPPTDTLLIEPGTDIQLGPEAYIVSRGLVLALGTEADPIRIRPADDVRPWAAFTIMGHGADNSIVRYTEFTGGGGGFLDGAEFIGMVNVHGVSNVEFQYVEFIENVRSDDTFHALHSEVNLRNSHFLRGNSDAVDYDVSTGSLVGNLIEYSGGDGIDLMTSGPFIANNHIIGSGDKGISVGEGSIGPVLFNNLIERCKRGIEVKDTSSPIILNNTLIGNKVGIYQRRKNWRYGGGAWALVANTVIEESPVDLETDAFSRVTLAGGVELDSVLGPGSATLPAEAPAPAPDLDWLYRSVGLSVPDATPGTVETWRRGDPVEPRWSGTFKDGFKSATDGWVGSGGVRNLVKREGVLLVEVETHPGRIELA